MSLVALPNGRPQERRSSPSGISLTANRCPSRTVWATVNSEPSYVTCVPASSLRVAIATLSPGAGRRPTSSKARRSLPLIGDHPPVVPDQRFIVAISVSQRGPKARSGLRVVAGGPGARRRGWSGGPLGKAPIVDADHVLGPLARRKIGGLL